MVWNPSVMPLDLEKRHIATIGSSHDVSVSASAQLVCQRKLALTDPALVGFKHLQSIGIGGPITRPYAGVAMPEVSIAAGAVILGYSQVQDQQLIALA